MALTACSWLISRTLSLPGAASLPPLGRLHTSVLDELRWSLRPFVVQNRPQDAHDLDELAPREPQPVRSRTRPALIRTPDHASRTSRRAQDVRDSLSPWRPFVA